MTTLDDERPPERFDLACYLAHHRFIASCHAFRELLDHYPDVKSLDHASIGKSVDLATKHLQPAQKRQANLMVLQLFQDRKNARAASTDAIVGSDDATLTDEIEAATPKLERASKDPGTVDIDVSVALQQVASELFLRSHRPPISRIMLHGILTELISAMELLLGRLHGEFYRAHPEALGDQKEFSLSELRSFANVDEAIDAAIQDRVDDFLRKPFKEWELWYAKYLKLNVSEYFLDQSVTLEILARRNVIVHNDSQVSKQYRDAVGPTAPPVGTQLTSDDAYVGHAIDQILVFGAALGAAAWQKIAPRGEGPKMANRHIHELNLYLMMLNRWDAVAGLAHVGGRTLTVDESDRLVYLVNRLLADKRRHGASAIQTQANALDVSAAGPRFRVAHAALMDDFDHIKSLIPVALSSLDMTMSDVYQWPLLDEFRKSEQYGSLMETIGPKPEAIVTKRKRSVGQTLTSTSATGSEGRPAPRRQSPKTAIH